jgi:hypothetical protein
MKVLRWSVSAVWRSQKIWWLQFVLNPVLFLAAVWWLTIPDARIWQLVLSVVLAIGILIALLWLHAGSFVAFADFHGEEEQRSPFAAVRPSLPAFGVWALLMALCLCLVSWLSSGTYQYASFLRSNLPLGARQALSESRIDSVFSFLCWCLFWIVIPGLFVPWGLQAAKYGLAGLGSLGVSGWSDIVHKRFYWMVVIVLAIVGAFVPGMLLAWHPKVSTFKAELVSLFVRLLVGWLLGVTAWMVLLSVVGRLSVEEIPLEAEPPAEDLDSADSVD